MSTGTVPRIIDNRYILDEDWREGGMARVYRAIDRLEHRTVAVKLLARELNPDERLLNRVFDGERRSLERLKHPNIVQLLDGGRDPETREPYFVFEWIDRNLAEALEAAPCTSWDVFANRFALPILDALAHAEERQVQHRDIKPANVLVTEEGIPKVSDFGIAKIRSDIQPGLTLAALSTKPYVPPRGEASRSRDVYAYAVLVLTTMAGIDPLDGSYEEDRYVAVTEAVERANVPAPVRDLLADCVSEDPDDRPQTAGALLGRLRGLQEQLTPAAPTKTYYLGLTNRARSDVLAALALTEEAQVPPAIEDDLAGGCALAPQVRDDQIQDGKFELFGAELRLTLAVDERTQDRFVLIGARALPSSLLEKRRERAYRATMTFKVGDPPNRIAARNDLLDLQIAAVEHAGDLRAQDRADEERRVFWTWKSTLRAKEQLEREKEAPIKFTSIEISGRRVTFGLKADPVDDVLGEARFRQVELLEGGYLGGEIYDVRGDEIDLAVRYGDPARLPSSGVLKVDTSASRTAITRQTVALDALLYDRALRTDLARLLMKPEGAALPRVVDDVDFVQGNLDNPKKHAVQKALGSDDFLVVQGPPGTGKTTFIAELVVQFARRNPDARILVTSQTHAALDNVLERLEGLDSSLRLVRVARPEDPRVSTGVADFLIDTVVNRWRDDVVSRGRAYLRRWAKERGISERDVEIATLYEEAAAAAAKAELLESERALLRRELDTLRTAGGDSETRERGRTAQLRLDAAEAEVASLEDDLVGVKNRLVQLRAVEPRDLDGAFAREFKERAESAVGRDHPAFAHCQALIRLLGDWHSRFGRSDEFYGAALLRAHVVAATCLGLHSFKGADAVEFDLCIIDEASKATATEALVPMVQAKRWVLVGDQRQLPPFIEDALLRRDILQEHELSERDIRETLLDRLIQRLLPACVAMLSTQHRMVPEIGELISTCFYDGELVSAPSSRPAWLAHVLEQPVVWYTTARSPKRYEASVGTSKANSLEARTIKQLIGRLNFAATHTGELLNVAVLSGYLAQLTAIERQLAGERDTWTGLQLECSSIDAFQGRECDILIYSVTRSNREGILGFLREERRLNVALSRGRFGLVLVGDHVFARGAGDIGNPFHEVVAFIERNEASCVIAEVDV
jgi:hypothetical protein